MADVIRLSDDLHGITQKLLPWYVTGTLDTEETGLVASHLESCAECREDLETERALSAMIALENSDEEAGWAALKRRVEQSAGGGVTRRLSTAGRFRLRSGLGWATGLRARGWTGVAQAAGLVLVAGLAWALINPPHAQYHVLSAPKPANVGNVVVVFKPTISEQQMRTTLRSVDARLVNGPTASDAYVLHVADGQRASIISKLRSNTAIVLAEAVDGGGDS